jgi:hypothetical protein
MRKLMASWGFAAVCVALARLACAPLFLSERADGATGVLLAADLFTIAIAAVVGRRAGAATGPAFFYGAQWAS